MINLVYFGKKISFSKKIPFFFAFQQSSYVPNAKILSITFQKQQMDYDYTKLLQLFIKLRHFHKKNEINIATKPILSKILATCLNFLFIFKFFLLFCNLIFKILRHTSFLVKNPLFLSVLLKK